MSPILGGSNYQALQVCTRGFEATDGTVHDCTLVAGHEGPHRYKDWTALTPQEER